MSPAKSQAAHEWRPLVGRVFCDAGLVAMLALAIMRCLVTFNSAAMWASDLSPSDIAITDIGPVGTAVADCLCIFALVMVLAGRAIAQRTIHRVPVVLWIIGAGFVLYHGHGDWDAARIGGNWLAATALGLAAMHLASDERIKRLVIAVLIALALPLAMGAVYQVAVQHGRNVQFYEETKAELFAQRGWQPDSIPARKYETRLMQNEATGWFGLANVFGSVMMTLGLAAGGCALALRAHRRAMLPAAALALLGLVAVVLTFGKGPLVAMALAMGAIGVAWVCHRLIRPGAWWWRIGAICAVLVAIGVVLVRGAMGPPADATGERSLLFRYFYWQGAARMVADHPIAGVGPDHFKEHYLVTKNSLSPEEVTDPHNVFIAYIAMLGLGGVAWSVLLVWWLWRAAAPVRDAEDEPEPLSLGRRITIVALVGAIAFGFQYIMHIEMLLIETAVMWIIGVAGFGLAAGWLSAQRMNRRLLGIGLLAAATGLLVHNQIEMAITNAMAGPILLIVLGTAAARDDRAVPAASRFAEPARWAACAVVAGVLAITGWRSFVLAANQMMFDAGVRSYQAGNYADALKGMTASGEPRHLAAAAHVSLIGYQRALRQGDGRSVARYGKAIEDLLNRFGQLPTHRSQLARDEAVISVQLHQRTGEQRWAGRAMAAAERWVRVDPYSVSTRLAAADMAWELGKRDVAQTWYADAITRNTQMYLDPDSQLPADDLARAHRRADSAVAP